MASMVRLSRAAYRTPHLTSVTRLSLPSSTVIVQSAHATTAPTKTGSGGKHWKYERVATVALLGLIPTGGFESILEDYTRQSLKKFMYPLLYFISLGTFAGLMCLNVTDVGICNAVKMLWSLK